MAIRSIVSFCLMALTACHQSSPTNLSETQADEGKSPAKQSNSPTKWHVATGALDPDCEHSGKNPDGGFQFMVPCPASSTSPDGKWTLVLGKEGVKEGSGAPVTVQKADGSLFASIPDLADAMPFVLYWSPRPDWFLVSHHVGSFMDRPEVYEIGQKDIVRHDGITRLAGTLAKKISPCLHAPKWDWVNGEAPVWSRDGKKIAWLFSTDTTACMGPKDLGPVPPDKQWKPFWMISDAKTGAILPGSVRIVPGDAPAKFPRDRLYAEFHPARP